jgi:hypothetical protein
MTASLPKPRQQPRLARLEARREQRRIAADYRETLGLLQAAVAPPPELLELFETMQQQIADLQARVAALENSSRGTATPAESEDGEPMPAGDWQVFKRALEETGFSATGLRKAIARAKRQGGRPWHWWRSGRLWIDVSRAPRKRPPA